MILVTVFLYISHSKLIQSISPRPGKKNTTKNKATSQLCLSHQARCYLSVVISDLLFISSVCVCAVCFCCNCVLVTFFCCCFLLSFLFCSCCFSMLFFVFVFVGCIMGGIFQVVYIPGISTCNTWTQGRVSYTTIINFTYSNNEAKTDI